MQKKWKIFSKSLDKLAILVLLLFSTLVSATHGYIPLDDTHIKLSDGRDIFSIRTGPNSHRIILKQNQKILWQKTFEEEYDRLWDYAFFVPVKKGHYSYDLNHDGNLEIAIATWDGGNAMAHRTALIFTVKKDSLEYYDAHKFNLEYGRYVYP